MSQDRGCACDACALRRANDRLLEEMAQKEAQLQRTAASTSIFISQAFSVRREDGGVDFFVKIGPGNAPIEVSKEFFEAAWESIVQQGRTGRARLTLD